MTEKAQRWTAAQSEENSTQNWFGDMAAGMLNSTSQRRVICTAWQRSIQQQRCTKQQQDGLQNLGKNI
jgi:hypothetical protein